MDIKLISEGMCVFVDKTNSPYNGQEGKVLSIFSNYGLESDVVSIRLLLNDGTIIGGFKADEVCP